LQISVNISLHSNFTCIGSSPSTILGVRKLDTGLPDGEDRIPLAVRCKNWCFSAKRVLMFPIFHRDSTCHS